MKQIDFTDQDQGKILSCLGLDPDTANMRWVQPEGKEEFSELLVGGTSSKSDDLYVPSWSLAALIKVMPSYIPCRDKLSPFGYCLSFNKHSVMYRSQSSNIVRVCFSRENLIDAVFEMVCWLLDHKYKMDYEL